MTIFHSKQKKNCFDTGKATLEIGRGKRGFARNRIHHFESGFTLVELIVAIGIFVVVVLAAVGSLYSVNNTARRVEAMRSVLDNLNFAIESMSRTIRTSTLVGCGNVGVDCTFASGPGDEITLTGTLGYDGEMSYGHFIDSGTGVGSIKKWSDPDGDGTGYWIPITAPGVDVQRLSFYVEGSDPLDGMQPKVIMMIQGVASAGENIAPFSVQTQVSVRSVEE